MSYLPLSTAGIKFDKNYIRNPSGELGTSLYTFAANASATARPTGFGGSPAGLSLAVISSSPLSIPTSFQLSKDAVNRQGQMAYIPFVIERKDQGKVLTISMDYEIVSGTYQGGSPTTDSDVIWLIYDETNAVFIEPAGFKMEAATVGTPLSARATFQSSINSVNYRLIKYIATTSASAYVIGFANLSVGPTRIVQGTPVTDWAIATLTLSNLGNATQQTAWRRVGDTLELVSTITIGSSLPTASGISFTLPNGWAFDTSAGKGSQAGASASVGFCSTTISAQTHVGTLVAQQPSGFYVAGDDNLGQWTDTVPVTWANGNKFTVQLRAPIVGWSSQVQMSDQADTRVVALKVRGAPTGTIAASLAGTTTTVFPTVSYDTHGGYNAGIYTVPVAGFYRVSVATEVLGTESVDSYVLISFEKNSTAQEFATTRVTATGLSSIYANGSTTHFCNAGDTLRVRVACTFTAPTYSGDPSANYMLIERVSGPSQIAATESVNARYVSLNSQVINSGANAIITTLSKIYDSHNGMNATTGVYTVPVSGKYRIATCLSGIPVAYTVGSNRYISCAVTGSAGQVILDLRQVWGSVTTYISAGGSTTFNYNAGDTITITIYNQSGSTFTLDASAPDNWITIERVGN